MLKPYIVLNDKSSSHLFISLHECADRHAMKMNIAQPLILYEYFFASTFTLCGTRWFSLQGLLSYHGFLFFSKCKSFWKGIINEEKYQTLASTHVSFLFLYPWTFCWKWQSRKRKKSHIVGCQGELVQKING